MFKGHQNHRNFTLIRNFHCPEQPGAQLRVTVPYRTLPSYKKFECRQIDRLEKNCVLKYWKTRTRGVQAGTAGTWFRKMCFPVVLGLKSVKTLRTAVLIPDV